MSKTDHAIHQINQLNTLAGRNQWMNQIHPLVKFVLTIVYIVTTVSFPKYDVIGLLGMMVYPLALFMLADLSFRDSLHRLRIVLPLVCLIGVLNPLFDHNVIMVGQTQVSAGLLSMVTLILKGIFCVFASYLLIATTTIEKICYALRLLHVPKIMVNQFLLTYRYITLLLAEVSRITQAYSLRAPKQKGIHFKVWGSLVGQLLLRSIDRADTVYESMQLRGFCGEFQYVGEKSRMKAGDVLFLLVWLAVFVLFRTYPVLLLVGNLMT
ncbi:MAG: cobalt ECF transporter T component CbiQ [Agathobacter sp.]|nr:cobalt ECF transporter T component CbiQ [Agathobacter sp.]